MPQTTALLQTELGSEILLEDCLFGNIFVSRIPRGTTIAPHCGPTNIRHRLHLPLVLPSSSSSTESTSDPNKRPIHNTMMPILKVREVETTWTPKTALVFDDSLCHSVEFTTVHEKVNDDFDTRMKQEERVVLVVDLFHPDLSSREQKILRDLYPAAK
jgi:aspartyl/asparaginyl beta-hydroxylase (cupin superfamily)